MFTIGRTKSEAREQFIPHKADCTGRVEKTNGSEVHEPMVVYFFAKNPRSSYGADDVGRGMI